MRTRVALRLAMMIAVATGIVGASRAWVGAQQAQPRAAAVVPIDPDDIGGVVTSAKGPEAGVWVIAETKDTPTKFARIVVTDDQGRYVVPDLPPANYDVFVRGYGLLDSKRQSARPGQQLNLSATVAPDAKAAAQVYPAAWWISMLSLPSGADEQLKFQQNIKTCYDCHQLGGTPTREMMPYVTGRSTLEKWETRLKFGPSGPSMFATFQSFGPHRHVLPDWTDRIAKGEAPKTAPPRPTGAERNLVVSLWDWGTPLDGRADNAAADLRDPRRLAADRKIYGVSQMTDSLNVLDPDENTAKVVKVPTSAPPLVSTFSAAASPSPVFGSDIWKRTADPRSVGIDAKGRVWLTVRTRSERQVRPTCGGPGANKYAKYYPLRGGNKQVGIYDPKTEKFETVDTCFSTDHNEMSPDNFIYYGSNDSIGWVDMNAWDRTHDPEQSTGWCPAVVDTNGDGKVTEGWTEPDEPVESDPGKDHRIRFGCYAIAIDEKDHSVWCSGVQPQNNTLVRIEKGSNPPQTCRAEVYVPPAAPGQPVIGTGGITIDGNGIVYDAWRVSGHLTAFDRRKCKSTKDAKADGQSCPEGWTIYNNTAEPTYSNSSYKAMESYLLYRDRWDTLGFGDAPLYSTVNTDSFELFDPRTKRFVTLRVPYPMSFFARSGSGRVDNPNTGWKGKGFWSSYSTYASWHIEGGKGTLPKAVKFQMRPSPLAK